MFYVSHDNHKAKNLTRFPKDRDGEEEEHNSGKPPSHKGTQQESKSNKGTTK